MTNPSFDESSLSETGPDVQSVLGHLEEQFGELQDRIDRLQRLAALGTMSAMLAHEVNNLLTPVAGYCQSALASNDTSLWRKAVEQAARNVAQLTTLAERIMSMAADQPTEMKVLPIAPIVHEAIACLGRDPSKDGIDLTIDVPADLDAMTDEAGLKQVLFNLILNARQAMLGKRGRLRISARAVVGHVEIVVSDSGVGIPVENHSRIFEPFFSTKDGETRQDRGGAGLGLHTCKRLLESMDGTIRAESRPGEGATFTIVLNAATRRSIQS
jgi:signal transduction histidine kinase